MYIGIHVPYTLSITTEYLNLIIMKIEINLKTKEVIINDKIYDPENTEQQRKLEQAVRIINQLKT